MWYNKGFKVTADPDAPKTWIHIYEPLHTTAPREAKPYCYMVSQIAFYKDKVGYEKIDEVKSQWNTLGTRWTVDPDLVFEAVHPFIALGDEYFGYRYYELTGGTVVWLEGEGWHVSWSARLVHPEREYRLQHYLKHKEEVDAFQAEIKERLKV